MAATGRANRSIGMRRRHGWRKTAGSLLTTKLFFPPVRRGYVPRPRLVERLFRSLHGLLTLLSAPAGHGKTTLLSEWRAGQGRDYPAAWLSLDAGDSAPVLLLRYLVTALVSLLDHAPPLIEPLSERELEVLRHLSSKINPACIL